MGISIFPSTAAEFVSNNFVVDMNDSTNNTVTLENVKQAGTYNISFASADSTFDIYFLDSDGALVAYTNTAVISASGLFQTVVILGVATDQEVSFSYAGTVNNTTGEGNAPGAGAYLESISPFDLPSIDDTATVIGGNFGTATTIQFVSGATELEAKNVVVTNGTSLVVTRPDNLIEDDAPYDLRAINTGVNPPTGTNAHILAGTVTAGSDPTWVTTSPLNNAAVGSLFSQTLSATDSDGTIADYSVTAGTITPGLSLDASTGVLSGTATTAGTATFTVTATDDGGNTTAREFTQLAGEGISGGSEVTSGGFAYHTFTSSDDLLVFEETEVEYLVIAGGAAGGGNTGTSAGSGGGGAGGLLSGTVTLSPASFSVVIGAGGAATASGRGNAGTNSEISTIGTAIGGGGGGSRNAVGGDGGSGGGGGGDQADSVGASGGNGTAGQGNDGGQGGWGAGGGGGAGAAASSNSGANAGGAGGTGSSAFSAWATATSTGDNGAYASGGGGGPRQAYAPGTAPDGGGANGGSSSGAPSDAQANTGGGGGGAMAGVTQAGSAGGSGIVIVRYAV